MHRLQLYATNLHILGGRLIKCTGSALCCRTKNSEVSNVGGARAKPVVFRYPVISLQAKVSLQTNSTDGKHTFTFIVFMCFILYFVYDFNNNNNNKLYA